jgi:hypothetical protein
MPYSSLCASLSARLTEKHTENKALQRRVKELEWHKSRLEVWCVLGALVVVAVLHVGGGGGGGAE